jgi:DNA processing protein
MNVKVLTLESTDFPGKLRTVTPVPKELFILSTKNINELISRPCVTIVGSRKVSMYGKTITSALAGELAKAGVVVISGLAIGVDSIAHRAALDAGGLTIAVLPSGFNHIYPGSHHGLAEEIVARGGALVSEYPPDTGISYKSNFIARNRITSGLGDALLITEAAAKSGTLHTAQFAIEQGKEVLAVPGNITSATSAGTNTLIKTGATPITDTGDIFAVLGIKQGAGQCAPTGANINEQTLLDLLFSGVSDGAVLLEDSKLPVHIYNQTLTMLEIRGHIRPLGNNHWALK